MQQILLCNISAILEKRISWKSLGLLHYERKNELSFDMRTITRFPAWGRIVNVTRCHHSYDRSGKCNRSNKCLFTLTNNSIIFIHHAHSSSVNHTSYVFAHEKRVQIFSPNLVCSFNIERIVRLARNKMNCSFMWETCASNQCLFFASVSEVELSRCYSVSKAIIPELHFCVASIRNTFPLPFYLACN